jgi:hypothetical protein
MIHASNKIRRYILPQYAQVPQKSSVLSARPFAPNAKYPAQFPSALAKPNPVASGVDGKDFATPFFGSGVQAIFSCS